MAFTSLISAGAVILHVTQYVNDTLGPHLYAARGKEIVCFHQLGTENTVDDDRCEPSTDFWAMNFWLQYSSSQQKKTNHTFNLNSTSFAHLPHSPFIFARSAVIHTAQSENTSLVTFFLHFCQSFWVASQILHQSLPASQLSSQFYPKTSSTIPFSLFSCRSLSQASYIPDPSPQALVPSSQPGDLKASRHIHHSQTSNHKKKISSFLIRLCQLHSHAVASRTIKECHSLSARSTDMFTAFICSRRWHRVVTLK